jgi:hypothetical protein
MERCQKVSCKQGSYTFVLGLPKSTWKPYLLEGPPYHLEDSLAVVIFLLTRCPSSRQVSCKSLGGGPSGAR